MCILSQHHLFIIEPKSFISVIKVNPFDDPTKKILLKCEAARIERKRNETREELQKIQERISFTIDQYEYSSRKALELLEENTSNGEEHVEVTEDPAQLYEILSDARRRAQYKQKFTVFIIGYEEKCENREKLLKQVEDFFMETKASNITKLADEISSEHDEFDFDDTLAAMSNALEATSEALTKLQKLQQDVSQVFSVYAAFPNDKKGRKKLEKALLKAQEESSKLNSSLVTVQDELDQTKEKSKRLQKQLDVKNSEIGKLQKSIEEFKLLKGTNESLQKELKDAKELLLKARQENEKLQKTQASSVNVLVSPEYLKLKSELESQKQLNEQLTNEHQTREAALFSEIETVKENYEAEISELRDKFEEQMKSLMDLDDMDFEDQHSSNEALMDDNMDYPGETMIKQEISDTMIEQMDNIPLPQEGMPNGNMEIPPESTHISHIALENYISRDEAEASQKQLEEELKETKSKSKKMIASLKAQIVEQQNKHEAIVHNHTKEVTKLKSQRDALKTEREQERSRYEDISTEKQRIEHELSQLSLTRDEQAHIIKDLQAQLDDLQQQVSLVNANFDKMSRSVQWETPIHTNSNTPAGTPMPSHTDCEDIPEIVSMHEIPLDDTGKVGSAHQQPASSQAGLARLEENSTLSSELSSTSMSPIVSPTSTVRRQIHESELPVATVNPQIMTMDHPIVKECQKVYKSILQFKAKMATLLASIGSPQSAAELNSVQHIKDDKKAVNVQSQVTLMRHNLTVIVDKIEQLLNNEIKRLAKPEVAVKTEDDTISQPSSEDELIKLRVELRNVRHTMETESQEHNRILRNLRDANDNLKEELAYLKKMATKHQQETAELIMFTRLDSDRNSLSLRSALQNNKISDEFYSQTVKAMEEYGSISSRQFINLAQQYKHCKMFNQIMHQLEGLNLAKKEAIQERIIQYSQRKSRCLSAELDKLRIQKAQLANALTSTLSEIENDTGIFLIKPIIRSNKNKLIEPSFRTPAKLNAPVRYSVDKTRGAVAKSRHLHHDRDGQSHVLHHPDLQQISGTINHGIAHEVSSRHSKLQLIDLLHKQRKVTTEVRTEAIVVYGSEPPSRRQQSKDSEKQWNVDESVPFRRPSSGSIRNHYGIDDGSTLLKSKTSVLPPINIPSNHITVDM